MGEGGDEKAKAADKERNTKPTKAELKKADPKTVSHKDARDAKANEKKEADAAEKAKSAKVPKSGKTSLA